MPLIERILALRVLQSELRPLGSYPNATALHLGVDQDPATDARAQRDHHDVGLALSCPELPFGPDGRVGVVVDKDGHRHALLQGLPKGLVTPRQMRGEYHCRPVRRHKPSSTDPYCGDGFGPDELQQLSDHLDDGAFDHRWALGTVRGVPARTVGDRKTVPETFYV